MPVCDCKTWNEWNFRKLSEIGLICCYCSCFNSFSLSNEYYVWRWDINIPNDWRYGQWDRIRLYPIKVKVFVVKCNECHEEYLVYPSFVLPGTTLTLPALIFISFAYEASDLSWRDIPEKFCPTPENRIAHSTLYKAVHGLGKSMHEQETQIREEIQKLNTAYPPPQDGSQQEQLRKKALYEHTQDREKSLHDLIRPLSHHCQAEQDFFRIFNIVNLPKIETVLSGLSPPIIRLYRYSSPSIAV